MDGRKDCTLSTTGKAVNNFYYYRQRLLIERVFHMLASVAEECACDQYVRTDELQLSDIEKQLPKKL